MAKSNKVSAVVVCENGGVNEQFMDNIDDEQEQDEEEEEQEDDEARCCARYVTFTMAVYCFAAFECFIQGNTYILIFNIYYILCMYFFSNLCT